MVNSEQLGRVLARVQQLVKKQEALAKENEKLRKENMTLTAKSEELAQKITSLEQTVQVLRTISGKMDEADRKNLDKRLAHYLKEIDRCIGMLSE